MAVGIRRPTIVAAVITVFALAAVGGPAAAQSVPQPPPTKPLIIGGDTAPPGAWPSQAAVLEHDIPDNYAARYCGATVLSPSWILTAGHCVYDESSLTPLPAAQIDVLAGTQDLTSGGQREQATETRVAPGFNLDTLVDDIALIRLSHPVNAPAMPIVSQGATFAPGTDLVTTGWGNQSATGEQFPTLLNEVHVPLVSDADCAAAYPGPPEQYFASSMICAGLLATGGKDSCNGDSGGPISAQINGTWVEIGTVSWGNGCAQAGFPGVYSRLSAFSNWIIGQIRYGAEPDAASFVRQQYLDFTGALPSSAQLAYGSAYVSGNPLTTYVGNFVSSAAWQSSAAAVARLYLAYFQRDADISGLGFWLGKLQHGATLDQVSNQFAASSEFTSTYGQLSNSAFVADVYQNVLDRPADPSGAAYWTSQLDSGARSRGQVMDGFSESNEFRNQTRARTDVTTTYFALLRRVPTSAEYQGWIGQPNTNLVRFILASYEYAERF